MAAKRTSKGNGNEPLGFEQKLQEHAMHLVLTQAEVVCEKWAA